MRSSRVLEASLLSSQLQLQDGDAVIGLLSHWSLRLKLELENDAFIYFYTHLVAGGIYMFLLDAEDNTCVTNKPETIKAYNF